MKFIEHVENINKRKDAIKILQIMEKITKTHPKMWGTSIIGFGKVHYRYKSGREGEMPMIGFSPRKQALTLYLDNSIYENEKYLHLFNNLGKYRNGKSCLYLNKLSDVDESVLEKIIEISLEETEKYIATHDGWFQIK